MKKFYIALLTMLLAITASAQLPTLYLRGANVGGVSNFEAKDANKFILDETTKTYTLTVSEISGEFKIADENWTIEYTSKETIVPGTEYELTKIGFTNMKLDKGYTNLTFTFRYESDTKGYLTVTTDTEVVPPVTEYPDIYLRGDNFGTNWSADEANKFTREDNVYTLKVAKLSGKFKIAGSEWATGPNFGYGNDDNNGTLMNLNTEYTLASNGKNMLGDASYENVTLTLTYTDKLNATLKITSEGEIVVPTKKVFTFYFENTEGWPGANAYVWDNDNEKYLGAYPGTALKTIVTNGGSYLAGSFEVEVLEGALKIIISDSRNDQNKAGAGDLAFRNHAIYTKADGLTERSYDGPAITSVTPNGCEISESGHITATDACTITVETLAHHTVYYTISGASIQNREGAEYTAAPDGKIELPGGTNGTLNIYTHDGTAYSTTPLSYAVSITTGIENVSVENSAAAEYYTLQGVRVAEPTTGIYLVRRGNTVTKEYIR